MKPLSLNSIRWAACPDCNYAEQYAYRTGYGFIESCNICAGNLNER
jgi:hypothetical protein